MRQIRIRDNSPRSLWIGVIALVFIIIVALWWMAEHAPARR
jgi:hypothetical protein